MARDFARKFYNSPAWKTCRKKFAKSKHNLCERCLAKGIYKPGKIVHHKIHLTPENINDPEIALSWDNLELLCRECHAEEHEADANHPKKGRKPIDMRRWTLDSTLGVVVDSPPTKG